LHDQTIAIQEIGDDVFYPQIKIDIKLQPWIMSPEEIQEYRTRLEKAVNIDIADD